MMVLVLNTEAGNNDTICPGDSTQLQGSGGLEYVWFPSAGLSNDTIANPVASPGNTTTYYLSTLSKGPDLIVNGNFSSGNTGLYSSYIYSDNLGPAGVYYIGSNSQTYHPGFMACTDHTSGNGNMMIVNGAETANEIVWQQSVHVNPYTDYCFSSWIQNVSSSTTVLASLQFSINGSLIGPVFSSPSTQCVWDDFYSIWNSGVNTTALISIVNQNTIGGGNDFCLDDISFCKMYNCSDSVVVTVMTPSANDLGADTVLCQGNTLVLDIGSGLSDMLWSTGDTTASIVVDSAGTYSISGSFNSQCSFNDTIHVDFSSVPDVLIMPADTMVCHGTETLWTATSDIPGTVFLWNSGNTNSSVLLLPDSAMLISVIGTSGGCNDTAYATVDVFPEPSPQISVSGTLCEGSSISMITGIFSEYEWQCPSGATSTSSCFTLNPLLQSDEGMYQLTVTDSNFCQGQASVFVDVHPLPVIAVVSNSPLFTGETIELSASGAVVYSWIGPSNFAAIGQYASVVNAGHNNEGEYFVQGTDASGCTGTSSVMVEILDQLWFPNVITPNGDIHNENFVIENGSSIHNQLTIFNRWGNEIYSTTDYNNTWNAQNHPDGVYYYIFRYGNTLEYEHHGSLSVLR